MVIESHYASAVERIYNKLRGWKYFFQKYRSAMIIILPSSPLFCRSVGSGTEAEVQ